MFVFIQFKLCGILLFILYGSGTIKATTKIVKVTLRITMYNVHESILSRRKLGFVGRVGRM